MKLADTNNLEKRCEDHLAKVLRTIDPSGDFAEWQKQTLEDFRTLRANKFSSHMTDRRATHKQLIKEVQAGCCCSSPKP